MDHKAHHAPKAVKTRLVTNDNYQQQISDLLELCQNEWVLLEVLGKEPNATTSIRHATKELRDGIKKLVQLQDNLDEIGNIVENNSEWNRRADILMEDVRKNYNLHPKVNMTAKVKPVISQSSPLLSSSRAPLFQPIPSQNNIKEEEEEEEEAYMDASNNLPDLQPPLDLTIEPSSSSDILRPASSASSIKNVSGKPFGRRSIILEDMVTKSPSPPPKKTKSLFPLLKGLRTSQSTPVVGRNSNDAPAQINFYKNDDNSNTDAKHFIFATDAIVDHPLRIGVGYGSYICYSCTITSDKGAPITVRKRYSDFVDLREELISQYPNLKKSLPKLPPKKVVGKFTPTFVEQRRRELEYFFKYVVLHPVVGASPIVRHWIAP
ncbi:unnamed protein product [Mucor hiemalis]